MTIVASFARPTQKAVQAAVSAGAEFILHADNGARKPPPGAGDTPWGARVDTLTDEAQEALREAGCDFLFVSLAATPLRLLNDDSIGYFGRVPATLPANLEERHLRAMERLPFEGAVVEADAGEVLTVGQAIEYAAAIERLAGPVLARASLSWGAGEMEQLRDMGFGGVVVDIADAAAAARIAEIRDAILAIPAQTRRRRGRAQARVPQTQNAAPSAPPDGGDDDDDVDDD